MLKVAPFILLLNQILLDESKPTSGLSPSPFNCSEKSLNMSLRISGLTSRWNSSSVHLNAFASSFSPEGQKRGQPIVWVVFLHFFSSAQIPKRVCAASFAAVPLQQKQTKLWVDPFVFVVGIVRIIEPGNIGPAALQILNRLQPLIVGCEPAYCPLSQSQ